ncbi:MAG: translation elongation factor G, partial [Faecalibacillus sp.]
MGEIQLEILKNIINERYQYNVSFDEGKITFLETISNKVEGVGHYEPLRHYAEVHIVLEPLSRGEGIIIENHCDYDSLPSHYQNLILSHMKEVKHIGVLTGSPITDLKMTLVSGKAHLKHTEGGDFREATYRAIRNGLKKAHSLLLEPYYQFEITIPSSLLSKIVYDLENFHGQYQITPQDENVYIEGEAPVRYMKNYHIQFSSLTKGEGQLFYSLSGYRECQESSHIISQINY